MAFSDQQNDNASAFDQSDEVYDSDDSKEDPTFDILEETQSRFSRFSIKKKSKPRAATEVDEDSEGEQFGIGMVVVPELDEKDLKTYDIIQKFIEVGQAEKLKVDQCKIYLRKHGLRLTGSKETLIQRIREHLDILNVGGENKYPASTFVVNCKGDACTGDVVLFEQNVYEMFNIASKSANGPPCGTRVIAGRIVKESYGAAKQQHTFTIEVLWSKGEKPLPPLHPLLIKGRNLYRLKTMRQEWKDEGERQKVLMEKHARGCVARSNREARIQEREIRKTLKSNRVIEVKDLYRKQQETEKKMSNLPPAASMNMRSQPQQQQENMQDNVQTQRKQWHLGRCKENTSARQEHLQPRTVVPFTADVQLESLHLQRQPLTSMNCNLLGAACGIHTYEDCNTFKHMNNSVQVVTNYEGPENHNCLGGPLRRLVHDVMNTNPGSSPSRRHAYQDRITENTTRRSFKRHNESSQQETFYHGNLNLNPITSLNKIQANFWRESNFPTAEKNLFPGPGHEKKRLCRYYAQGRCYYGNNCKHLHEC